MGLAFQKLPRTPCFVLIFGLAFVIEGRIAYLLRSSEEIMMLTNCKVQWLSVAGPTVQPQDPLGLLTRQEMVKDEVSFQSGINPEGLVLLASKHLLADSELKKEEERNSTLAPSYGRYFS